MSETDPIPAHVWKAESHCKTFQHPFKCSRCEFTVGEKICCDDIFCHVCLQEHRKEQHPHHNVSVRLIRSVVFQYLSKDSNPVEICHGVTPGQILNAYGNVTTDIQVVDLETGEILAERNCG